MKKVISLLLIAFLLLSLIATAAVSVAAEDEAKTQVLYEIPNELAANQKDGNSEGWRNSKVDSNKDPLEIMELDGQIGLGATFSGAEPNYFNTIRFLYYTATPLDLSEIVYVEFDLYISDSSKYTSGNSIMVELCSSGRQDASEISTGITPEIKEGWNHIRIDFSTLKSGSPEPFDITAWNFFRLCINGPYDTQGGELTVALANLVLWNGLNEDGLNEEEAKRQELLASVQPALDKVNEFKDIKSKDQINADNLASIKELIAQAYELYNALNEEQKDLFTSEDGFRILKTAERAVEKYEEEQAELTPPPSDNEGNEGNGNENDNENDGENNDDGTVEIPENNGCKSALTIGATMSMLLAAAWVAFAARKRI
jgi:hypothetical protein